VETETTDTGLVVKDSCGNLLQDGDAITVIKDLKVKGAAQPLKVGTKVKNIRLVDGDHNIDCKIPGFGAMQLKIRVCEEGVGLYCGWGRRPRLQQAAARPIASSICA
jgi:alkylphosphonate utilization operon protein PhnA